MSLKQYPYIEEGDLGKTIGLYKDPNTDIKVRTAFFNTIGPEYLTTISGAASATGMHNFSWFAAISYTRDDAVLDFQAWINFARFPAELMETQIATSNSQMGVELHKAAPSLFDEQGRPIAAALESLYHREEGRYAEESNPYGQAEMAAALVKARGNVNAASRLLSKD